MKKNGIVSGVMPIFLPFRVDGTSLENVVLHGTVEMGLPLCFYVPEDLRSIDAEKFEDNESKKQRF
ncbi:hypothetical protein [Alteribacillus sp. YIM 98480]|uniref:hypothetical protein n=1 Tax=Alteribacillus sp. YIM 98480 TaxID=2606599 RepID=UPI00131D20B9|nr:hypothetical protein [Alteribacillus sp. YIM 98480]